MSIELERIIWLLFFLILSYLWFSMVIWVNIDARRKKRDDKLWNMLTFLLGPIGIILYKKKAPQSLDEEIVPEATQPPNKEKRILKIVNQVLQEAVVNRATDIHFESSEYKLITRFRIDGFLYDYWTFTKSDGEAIISSVKVLSDLDIAQKRSYQDGSFSETFNERRIDFRVAVSGSHYGESMVLRILDPQEGLIEISKLGVSPELRNKFDSLIFRNDGIVLVTGPTGCGKTTTLYAILNKVNNLSEHIISIEDPIEYRISNVTQIPVNPRAGVTFVNSLRSILRQDPDIIMIGEIRDVETGKIAIEASLTGHLVFSTLHTRDSVNTIIRLIEMGFEPYLISSSLVGVISQRLIRLLCPKCKRSYVLEAERAVGNNGIKFEKGEKLYAPGGCSYCRFTGYRGRTGLFEILAVDKGIRELISKNVSAEEMLAQAKESGLITLLEDGTRKIREGITSIEEVEDIL